MSRVKRSISLEARKLLYFAHIHSHLTYCLPLFTLATKTDLSKLIRLQKKSLRIVFNKCRTYPSSTLFHSIATLPLDKLLEREIIKLMYSIHYFEKPKSLISFFQMKENEHNINLRISLNYQLPFIRSSKLQMHPLYALPRIWNNSKLTCKYNNVQEEFLSGIRNYYFSIQEVNSCSKRFCKICNYIEWIKHQKLNRNYVVKSTEYIRYSLIHLVN